MPNESQFAGGPAVLSPTVQSLFPSGVVAAEWQGEGNPATLFAEERSHVRRAVDKRVREFAAGRACARLALAQFGFDNFPLRAAPDRQPQWPDSMVGSITHTDGYCTAVAASKELACGIGVDSERIEQVGRDLWPTIAGESEYTWCMSLPEADQQAAMTLLFSAKEAFYKCQYPLTAEWLDFHDLRVEPIGWRTPPLEFTVHFTRQLVIERHLPATPRGRCLITAGRLTAGIALPAAADGQPAVQ